MRRTILSRERLIVALDLPEVAQAERLVAELGDSVGFYKVGMELAYGGGFVLVEQLVASGKQVFLDLKLHDIPNTVERAVAQIARLGATFLTIHAYPQTMRAAVAGREGSTLKLLAVSVLTSCDDADLREAGYAFGVGALRRASAARRPWSRRSMALSPARRRRRCCAGVWETIFFVTPGIRPSGAEPGDQKRASRRRPGAILDGADYLVVGRPVTQASDPRAAAEGIIAQIAAAR